MKRKILWGVISIIVVASLGLTVFIGVFIFDQYQDTKHWESSPLIDDIHNVPPAFASNYMPLDDRLTLEILTKVNATLESIAKSEGIPSDKIATYVKVYEEAKALEVERELEGNAVMTNTNRLGLYIDIERTLEFAYVDPNPEPLQLVSNRLATYMLEDLQPLDTLYYNRLSKVSSDYVTLQKFSSEALASLGVLNGTILTVDVKMTYDMTHNLIQQIEDSQLTRFEHVEKLEKVLKSDEWARITKANASTRKFYEWEESRKVLEALMKSDYVPISSLITYSDALAYHSENELIAPQGYIIDPNSPIAQISYAGRVLKSDEYVKRGTHLIFDITPEYILVERPVDTPVIEEPQPEVPPITDEIEEPMEDIDE